MGGTFRKKNSCQYFHFMIWWRKSYYKMCDKVLLWDKIDTRMVKWFLFLTAFHSILWKEEANPLRKKVISLVFRGASILKFLKELKNHCCSVLPCKWMIISHSVFQWQIAACNPQKRDCICFPGWIWGQIWSKTHYNFFLISFAHHQKLDLYHFFSFA